MNFPFFIARRYLFSKKSTHVINVISSISVIGVAVATMALVIVLSVFNGFHDLVASLFTSFDPQLKVVPVEGKTAPADDPILTKIRLLPQVDVATETVEDQALAIYNDHQAMVKIKGVDDNFAELSHITDILYGDGSFSLHAANLEYGTVGIRLAQNLGIGAQWDGFLKIYAPKKEGQLDMTNPGDGLWQTHSTLLECFLPLNRQSMIKTTSSLLSHLPVISLDSKVCSLIWRYA